LTKTLTAPMFIVVPNGSTQRLSIHSKAGSSNSD
jgi:hypothetical protein